MSEKFERVAICGEEYSVMELKRVANWVMDELFPTMDANDASSPNDPPDIVAHDKAYHHGHYDGKGKCKYREDRAAALSGVSDLKEQQDIIDRLNPEDVAGEEIDKADDLSSSEKAEQKKKSQEEIDADALAKARELGASWAIQPKTVAPEIQKKIDDTEELISAEDDPELAKLMKWSLGRYKKEQGVDNTADKLAAVKAFAKAIGLDPALLGGVGSQKSAKKGSLKEDIDLVRNEMRNMTPELAAMLSAGLDALAAGKDPLAGGEQKSEKSKKNDKEAAKKIKAASLSEFRDKIKKSKPPMKLVNGNELKSGEVNAVDSATFKSLWDSQKSDSKIIAVSDMHGAGGSSKGWDFLGDSDADIVLVAGDMTDEFYSSPKFNESASTQIDRAQKWIDGTLKSVCDKHPSKQFVLIPGNHDNILGIPEASQLKFPANVTLLNDGAATIGGMKVYGTGICEQRKGSSASYNIGRHFELNENDFKSRADQIPEGLDILMIHQPPKAEGYEGDKSFFDNKGSNCGSEYLTKIIEDKKPKMVICGHLHDGDHRPYKIGDTVVINASRVQSSNTPVHTPHRIGVARANPDDLGFWVDGEDNHII